MTQRASDTRLAMLIVLSRVNPSERLSLFCLNENRNQIIPGTVNESRAQPAFRKIWATSLVKSYSVFVELSFFTFSNFALLTLFIWCFSELESRIDRAYLPKTLRNQCPDGLRIHASANEIKVLVLYTGNHYAIE